MVSFQYCTVQRVVVPSVRVTVFENEALAGVGNLKWQPMDPPGFDDQGLDIAVKSASCHLIGYNLRFHSMRIWVGVMVRRERDQSLIDQWNSSRAEMKSSTIRCLF